MKEVITEVNVDFNKLASLQNILLDMGNLLLAYSAGADSTFLLKVAHEVLKENLIAVTANSPIFSFREIDAAKRHANMLGVKHVIIDTNQLSDEGFVSNPPNRCYYCKRELFSQLIRLAKEHGFKYVVDGSNFDDINDFRPGRKAASEYGVRSPLQEAMLTKEEIRILSRKMNLPTWSKPSSCCLASRFPYGVKLTKENLTLVNEAEGFLLGLGFQQVRIRIHGTIARIEVSAEDMSRVLREDMSRKVVERLQELGYSYVTLDLQGYRTGSMNEPLDKRLKDE